MLVAVQEFKHRLKSSVNVLKAAKLNNAWKRSIGIGREKNKSPKIL